jgi:hypothetical protein
LYLADLGAKRSAGGLLHSALLRRPVVFATGCISRHRYAYHFDL